MKSKRILLAVLYQYSGKIIAILTSIYLARVLGSETFGSYSFFLSLANILMLPIISGIPQVIIKEIGRENLESNAGGIVLWSSSYILLTFLLMALMLFCIVYGHFIRMEVAIAILFFIFFKSFLLRNNSILTAYKYHDIVVLITYCIQPIIFLALVYLSKVRLESWDIILYQSVAFALVCMFSFFMIQFVLNLKFKRIGEASGWFKRTIPFSFLNIVNTFNTEISILVVGILLNMSELAQLKVAGQFSIGISLSMSLTNAIVSSDLSKYFYSGDMGSLQSILKKSTFYNSMFNIGIIIIYIVFGMKFIELAYGEEYKEAYLPMLILAGGQVINSMLGSSGTLLNMSGNEKINLKFSVLMITANVLLMLSFVSLFGVYMAALISSVTLIFWKGSLTICVYRKLGLKTWLH